MHALGAIDQPRTPLEGAIGGEGQPMGRELGGVEPCREWSVEWGHRRSRSEQRTFARLVQVEFGDFGQSGDIGDEAPAMLPLHQAARGKPLSVLLVWTRESPSASARCSWVKGKRTLPSVTRPTSLGAEIEVQEVVGRAFDGVAAADAQEILVEDHLLGGGEPGQVEGEARAALVQLPHPLAGKGAKHRRGQRVDRMVHLALHRATGCRADRRAARSW